MANLLGDLKFNFHEFWPSVPALEALLPQTRLFTGALPAGPVPPFGQFTAREVARQPMTPALVVGSVRQNDYLATVELTVRVWATSEDSASRILEEIHRAYGTDMANAPGGGNDFINFLDDSRLLHCLLTGQRHEAETDPRRGEQLWRGEIDFELLVARGETFIVSGLAALPTDEG